MSIEDMVNEGVRRAYNHPDNKLRASVLTDPDGARKNTGDNSPAMITSKIVPGHTVTCHVMAKGGGSEAKAKFAMLNPSDSVVDWVLKMVPTMGACWCPPGILGVGIGAQGLGGLTTVLDVKVKDCPTHAANKPIAILPNCAATRLCQFTLDGSGPSFQTPPSLSDWPEITRKSSENTRSVNLDTVTPDDVLEWKPGDTLLLSGKLLTGRDAAHKRMVDMIAKRQALPVDLKGRFIDYVGPVDPVREEVVGPAGPTTATRMYKFTRTMLEETGLLGMVGKAERGDAAIAAIKDNKAVYLVAVGGSAYLVSKAIISAKVVAFEDLGMEAIYEFEIKDMPVTVAVDSDGESVHHTGPEIWKAKIEQGVLTLHD